MRENVFARRETRLLDLRLAEWLALLLGASGAVALVSTGPVPVDQWSALGLGLTLIVLVHMCLTAGRYVVFPDLIAFAACLQWIVAPWLSQAFPPHLPVFRMTLPVPEYLQYAVPATAALWIGLHLPARRVFATHAAAPRPQWLPRRIRYLLDTIIVIGLIVQAYSDSFPESLAFLAYLIASFRFFGALGWLLTETPGWWLRVTAVLLQLVAQQSAGGGVFYLVVEWGGYFLLVYAFMRRWRWRLAVAVLVGLVGIGVLQEVKGSFRNELSLQETKGPVDSLQALARLMWDRVHGIVPPGADADFNDALVRFNQGWIITRVMTYVPVGEPYAMGGTVADAVEYSIVPRFLVEKSESGSRPFFERYTGVNLPANTRMALGIIGEMYANFSFWGGLCATFAYACLMGWLFALFAARAARNPLWWAAASIVVLPGVEPGLNLADIMNHVIKAGVVLIVALYAVPTLRQLLAAQPAAAHADEERAVASCEPA